MVLINYKKTENNQFLYECPAKTPIETVVHDLVESKLNYILKLPKKKLYRYGNC